jgi:anti-sigma factor RsiW
MSDRLRPGDHEAVRPYLAARPGELAPAEARALTEHLSRCRACAAEAAGYHRLAKGLAAMRELEAEAPAGLLGRLVEAAVRPRLRERALSAGRGSPSGARGARRVPVRFGELRIPALRPTRRVVATAAGSAGAIVAGAFVAIGVVRARRRSGSRPSLRLPLPAAVLAPARAR